MVNNRAPGVFMERGPSRPTELGLLPSGIPVFLGMAQRGPTNEPVRVTSIEQFYSVFGKLPAEIDTFLAASIDGFFLNGGRECYVMRIAHLFDQPTDDDRPNFRAGAPDRFDFAIKSSARLRDGAKQNTLLAQAMSEGVWGNEIRVSVVARPSPVQTFLTVDGQPGDNTVMVKSTYGFARGTQIKLSDGVHEAYRVITAVEGRVLYWGEREPLETTFASSAPTLVEPVHFDLIAETHSQREVFRDLNLARQSPRFAERVVNGVSQLITVTDLSSDSPMPLAFPVEVANQRLEGGADGLFTVRPEDFNGMDNGPGQRYGLLGIADFEQTDLVCMPDLAWCVKRGLWTVRDMEVVQQQAVAICEEKQDRFAILDVPPDYTPTGAMQWRRLFDTSYAALYYPFVKPNNSARFVPPSGHVAGIFARCDREMGVYRAPANEAFQGVVDLQLILQQGDLAMLNGEGVNCLQVLGQRGIRVWGARTASSEPQLLYINVRRTILAIARALYRGLQWVVFEPNDYQLWHIIQRDVGFFLDALWRQGYLKGESAEQAYVVRCDESVNNAESITLGQVAVDVWLAPFRPAEFIGVHVVQEVDSMAQEGGV